jgi:hypothetical protein
VNARKAASAPRTRRASRNTSAVGNEPEAPPQPPNGGAEPEQPGALRVAGVAEPLEETQCRVSGCMKNAQYAGLCAGHYASRRGDGVKPSREGCRPWMS